MHNESRSTSKYLAVSVDNKADRPVLYNGFLDSSKSSSSLSKNWRQRQHERPVDPSQESSQPDDITFPKVQMETD